MNDERKNEGARQSERQEQTLIHVRAFWWDYHGTAVYRKPGVLKEAAEKALGHRIRKTAGQVDAMVERACFEYDRRMAGREIYGPDSWIEINSDAFFKCGCDNEDKARRMSDFVREEGNYISSKRRLEFIKQLIAKFPPVNSDGRYVLTASNADFTVISKFLQEKRLFGVTAVSGNLLGVYKPDLAFFERLIGVTGVPPEQTLFVCNSWRNDSRAAILGVNVVIILPSSVSASTEEIMGRVGETKGRIFIVRSLAAARDVIDKNFVSSR